MHHSFPNTDQYFWPDILSGFPPSPAPSTGTPQMQLDLYDPTSTTFYQNSFKELENFSAPPCTNYSTPPGRGDVWNASSQLYYVNPRPPGRPTTQNPPGQQLVFGDNLPHYSFDMDSLFSANKDHSSAPIAPITVHDPPAPPRFLPLPPPPKNQTSYPQSGQLEGRNSLTCPIPSEPVSKSDDAFRKEDSRATAPLPKRQPSQRASDRSSKKRKAVKDAKIGLLPCCMVVKPESLARHLKSDGHKRNAGLPLDRPEACSFCNIAFARQDARNRHFRSQHGVDPSPATSAVYKRLKKPSATHPSLLPKRRK